MKRIGIVMLVVVVALMSVSSVGRWSSVQAQAVEQVADRGGITLPYAGQLEAAGGGAAADGAYEFSFVLYGVPAGGSPLWSEMQNGVRVQDGSFATLLGVEQAIPAQALANGKGWLSVSVRGPGEATFVELAPRQEVQQSGVMGAAAVTAGPTCAHDHLGQVWNASIGWSQAGLKIVNSANGPSFWGVNSGGGNGLRGTGTGTSLGVFGGAEKGAGVVGRSSGANGIEGYGDNTGVRGESTGTGTGVVGYAAAGSGVAGYTDSSGSVAVFGQGPGLAMYSNGDAKVDGDLFVTGAKSGYVVDVAQNVDAVALEQGDVVEIVGASAPVMGKIPVLSVRRATTAATLAVAGVVDRGFTPGTLHAAGADGGFVVDAATDGPSAPGAYVTLVTLGAFAVIKVDATYGAIAPGDLLVAAPHPGYAMHADAPAVGTVIGKALGQLDTGAGTIPVLVTLQ